MDLHDALDRWRVGEPRNLIRADAGLNNLSHFVDAPEGRYFLRRHENAPEIGRVRYEHALLARLQSVGLSFEVPRPLETGAGETLVETGGAAFALFPEIRGLHPERGNIRQIEACGAALGELDGALSGIEAPEGLPARPEFGDLQNISPLVSDPLKVADSLPPGDGEKTRLRALFERMAEVILTLYARLPRQLVHSDLSYGNVLMAGEEVSGVLDFEFAAPDLRALDFTAGLEELCLSTLENDARWPLVEAFSKGYGERTELTREEVEALPDLLLLRGVAVLVHWSGRLRAGLTNEENLVARCRDTLNLEGWLHSNGEELVSRVGAAES